MSSERDRPPLDETLPVDTRDGGTVVRFSVISDGAVLAQRYRVVSLVGTGGNGQVFRVEDLLAGGEAALKVLFPHVSSESKTLERLRRELQLLRELRHPGIVGVRDVGEHQGLLFLVMDLLEGETLAQRMRSRGRLDPDEAARVLTGILESLESAHAAGVVHRDVKPSNVFLARDRNGSTDDERVVLLDFGLARRGDDARVTETGAFVGTLEYVSPEQVRGDSSLTPATDLYSAGIVAWEMLTGTTPFAADSAATIVAGHLDASLPHPRAALGHAPPWLRDLITWMLEKEPEVRPPSATRVLDCLRARSGRSTRERWRAWTRSAGRLALLGAVAAVVALAAALVAWLPVEVERREQTLVRTSALGLAVDTVPVPHRVFGVVPLDGSLPWTRRYVGALTTDARDRFSAEYPSGLFTMTPLDRRARPLTVPGFGWSSGARHFFSHFDHVMKPDVLRVTPWTNEHGRKLLLYGLKNVSNTPSVQLFLDEKGRVARRFEHPGHLRFVALLDEPRKQAVSVGTNMRLGDRGVVAAFTLDMDHPSERVVAAPPYEEPAAARGRPAYYTLLSLNSVPATQRDGDALRVVDAARDETFSIDLATGVPLDREQRGGLSVDEWTARRDELHRLLDNAARDIAPSDAVSAARALETFAAQPMDPAMIGVALSEAARHWQRADRHERALSPIERALRLEPHVSAHRRRLVDVVTRLEGWRAARTRLEKESREAVGDPRIVIDLSVAALLTGEGDEAVEYIDGMKRDLGGRVYQTMVSCLLLAVHEPDVERLDVCRAIEPGVYPTMPLFAFLEAMVLATADPPRPHDALATLERHERGWGMGKAVPVVPLRAHLARLGAGEAPPTVEVKRAMREQERAARTSLFAWYMLEVAERSLL